jgi:carboxypeptidase Taq
MSITAVQQRIATVSDLLCTLNLLVWDSRTMMPSGGAESRGRQIATVTRLARDEIASDAMLRDLEVAEAQARSLPEDHDDCEALRQIRRAVDLHRRVPADLIERRAAVRARANAAWVEARERSDYSIFEPWLAETVRNTREYADALGWTEHPYDALLGLYEPGETLSSLRGLFAILQAGEARILASARERPKDAAAILRRRFPVEKQREAALSFSRRFGYDFDRGRLDSTVHPFEISFTRGDVRITTRYNENFLSPALFGAFHETGHGLYEQNVGPAFTRTVFASDLVGLYAVGGTSFGAHESQSRLWENHVGRSRRFWELHFGELQALFPDALSDVDAATFHRAVTTVNPGFIRTDADELTYDLHIMLRVEIEAALTDGSLSVADAPEAWNAAVKARLGLDAPEPRLGILQDIHWSSGMIGSFCTYTVGNVMAAQLFETARRDAAVSAGLEAGDYAPLAGWLRDKVWRHGRRRSREALLVDATGRGLDPAPYLRHLEARYGAPSKTA